MLGPKCLCFGEEPRHPPALPAAAGRGQCWVVWCWCRGHPSGAPGSGTLPCAAPAAGQPRPQGDRASAPLLISNTRLRASLLWHYRAPVFLAGPLGSRARAQAGVEGAAAGRGGGHRGVVTLADPRFRPRAWRPLTKAQTWGGRVCEDAAPRGRRREALRTDSRAGSPGAPAEGR